MSTVPYYEMIILLILARIFSTSAHNCETEAKPEKRIIKGFEVKPGAHPYVVAIFLRETHVCGGTLVTPSYVVTAAHCVDEGGSYSILAGTVDLEQPGIRREIKNITVHPDYEYDYVGIKYDLAVVKLDDPLPIIRKRVMFVKLPKFSTEIPQEWGTVMGWGDQKSSKREIGNKNHMMGVQLIQEECNATEYFFCLGHPDGDKDSCDGDSGGPFIINRTLYGIVSHGTSPYCASGFPGVYVNVPFMVNWIKKTANIPKCILCPVINLLS